MTFDLATLNRPQLTALYNAATGKDVKPAATHAACVARLQRALDETGQVVGTYGNGDHYVYDARLAQISEPEAGEPQFDDEAHLDDAVAALPLPAAEPAPAKTGKRGPAPKVSDDHVILTVAANPKRESSSNHARYALYRPGMRVGDFLKAAVALQGNTEGRWRGDVFWDVAHGFITVGPAPKQEG